jgi:hypothetical protein
MLFLQPCVRGVGGPTPTMPRPAWNAESRLRRLAASSRDTAMRGGRHSFLSLLASRLQPSNGQKAKPLGGGRKPSASWRPIELKSSE